MEGDRHGIRGKTQQNAAYGVADDVCRGGWSDRLRDDGLAKHVRVGQDVTGGRDVSRVRLTPTRWPSHCRLYALLRRRFTPASLRSAAIGVSSSLALFGASFAGHGSEFP